MSYSFRMGLMACTVAAFAVAGCKHHNDPNEFDFSMPEDMSQVTTHEDIRLDDLVNFEAAICAQQTQQAKQVGVDLLFLLDNSYSMDYSLKWVSVANALEAFLNDPTLTGVGAGLQYFPLRQACNINDYATPGANGEGVLITPLTPAGISTLDTSINSRQMFGGTPTLPAIQGTLQYAVQNQTANSSRKTVVVLATDGIPDGTCGGTGDGGLPNDIASVVNVVGKYAKGSPAIPTYVIGVGSNLEAIDAIAEAGSGQAAFHVDTSGNTEEAFADALNAIRQQSLVCQFAVPVAQPGQTLDYDKVNLTFSQAGSTVPYVYVTNKAGCTNAPFNGWYYDNPTAPTEMILCDDACTIVRNSTDGQINIVVGCAQIVS